MEPTSPSIPGVSWSKWSMPDPLSAIAGPFWDHRRVLDTLPWQPGATYNRTVHHGRSMDPAASFGSHLESSVQVLSAGFPNLSKCSVISWPWIKLIRAERIIVVDSQPQRYSDPFSREGLVLSCRERVQMVSSCQLLPDAESHLALPRAACIW